MRTALLAIALTACIGAAAAGDTHRFAGGVVGTGDSIAALIQRAGQPDRIVRLENRRGAAVGERWEYYQRGSQVNIVISGGRVQSIEDLR